MDHWEKTRRWLREPGVEIGAFKTPIPGIAPIYIEKFPEFAYEKCVADYYGEATELPLVSNSVNYVASSHVLEHVANPVLALREWYRVLRPGGVIYMVLPDRRYTWDRFRDTTSVGHMMEDFERGTTASDATHIDEFLDRVDWPAYSPNTKAEDVEGERQRLRESYHHAVRHGAEINIHFHVFEPGVIAGLVQAMAAHPKLRMDWRLVDLAERFPSDNPIGFLAVIRVGKGLREWFEGVRVRGRWRRDPASIMTKTARPFPPDRRPARAGSARR